MRKKKDKRLNEKYISWKQFLLTFFVLEVLTSGQALVYSKFTDMGSIPIQYIIGIMGYWAIVTLVVCLFTSWQRYRDYDKPMHRLSEAAKKVAEGDFSVWVEPIHYGDKKDYVDFMFEDFNKMVGELGSIETLKSDFISNVSHEIKTPLSVIQSYAMALQKNNLEHEKQKEYTGTIISACQRLTALVTNILKLNKLENQGIKTSAEPFDLCRQLCNCALSFENLWEEKNIEFVADIEERAIIFQDEGMLEIVWNNLLSNALKFTEPGGIITLLQTSDENSITVSVTDTGCGMDEETTKRVFDKFYQGDTSRSQEGNGLGLALCHKVIEQVGGRISVKSTSGVGTTFTVFLKVS